MYTISALCTVEFTDNVQCTYPLQLWVHFQCALHVHSVPVGLLTVSTRPVLYFVHPQSVSTVRCAPVLRTVDAYCADGARGARVEYTARAPRAPTFHYCAENLLCFSRICEEFCNFPAQKLRNGTMLCRVNYRSRQFSSTAMC